MASNPIIYVCMFSGKHFSHCCNTELSAKQSIDTGEKCEPTVFFQKGRVNPPLLMQWLTWSLNWSWTASGISCALFGKCTHTHISWTHTWKERLNNTESINSEPTKTTITKVPSWRNTHRTFRGYPHVSTILSPRNTCWVTYEETLSGYKLVPASICSSPYIVGHLPCARHQPSWCHQMSLSLEPICVTLQARTGHTDISVILWMALNSGSVFAHVPVSALLTKAHSLLCYSQK